MHMRATPNYTHSHMLGQEPVNFASTCSMWFQVDDRLNQTQFEVVLYPGVTDGQKFGVKMKVLGNFTASMHNIVKSSQKYIVIGFMRL